jgi:hypothetical protein
LYDTDANNASRPTAAAGANADNATVTDAGNATGANAHNASDR